MAVIKCNSARCLYGLMLFSSVSSALVLPEDRVDTLYHSYDGGGIEVTGPSVLVRKSVLDSVSVTANYYVDSISSASVDVVTRASKYSEERTQLSASVDYLYDSSILSYSFTTSTENDYEAQTSNFAISQEMFGGLTAVALSYKFGNNDIMKTKNDVFHENSQTKGYRASLSQVLTKNMLLGMAYEVITDAGFLNNPYREVRFETVSPSFPLGYAFTSEVYPESRTSNAIGFNLRYYLPHRASISGGYRYYLDSWDIEAHTFDMGYVQPYDEKWLFDFNIRIYSQTKASFYNDLFEVTQSFMARDKELSTFSDQSIGFGVTYKLSRDQLGVFEKGSVNFAYSYFTFKYDDFRDVPYGKENLLQGGAEPLYELNANVIRFYLSAWF